MTQNQHDQKLFGDGGRGYNILSKHKLADGTFFFHALLTYESEKPEAEIKQAVEDNPKIIKFPVMRGA